MAKEDDIVVARTGYTRCNSYPYKFNGLNNARLKLVGSFSEVEIDKPMREKNIDLFLFEILFEQLWRKDFNTLIITHPDIERKLYSKVLGILKDCGKITSWYRNHVRLGPVYEVRI